MLQLRKIWEEISSGYTNVTLQGTNISPLKAAGKAGKMIFLVHRWDTVSFQQGMLTSRQVFDIPVFVFRILPWLVWNEPCFRSWKERNINTRDATWTTGTHDYIVACFQLNFTSTASQHYRAARTIVVCGVDVSQMINCRTSGNTTLT